MTVERADFDDLVTLVIQGATWEKDRVQGARILLRAIGEGKADAPEQILAEPVDARTDQFSFCIALYEGLYGKRPFSGSTPEELFESTLDGKMRPFDGEYRVPRHVRAAVRRGLSIEPSERFPTMDALLAVIEPRVRRTAMLAVGAAGLVAIAAGATIFAMLVMPVALSAYAKGSAAFPRSCEGTMPVSTAPMMM